MIIKDLFDKPIDRYIETVIKADDKNNISEEVTEYVITNEIAKKIRDFFYAYNNYGGANGVWISGFFGSGKSHLLKILSYVLANKVHDDYKCGELFAEKIEDDEMLKGDIIQATRIPSESILFNIDQQAQITSKTDAKAILSVFYKVFFDHLGYYGFQPHVAEFEAWVDKQGKYDDFKIKFAVKHGKSWQEARIDYFDPLVTDDIAEVLSDLNGHDATKYESILDDLEDKHKQSIEDFCERVNEYIKSKPTGFRLNFFVDEVGQYISDNTKLMLNLQTIAETLATKTRGSSWILVTSQEDMEKVVGDMNKQQQNDFSRIQARFKIKIPLTSANVDEVIEKRLLKKKDAPQKLLADDFKRESAYLESLLSFSEAGVQFKGYSSGTDYGNKYPFVPYQFDLFQSCRRALSTHNAFQGKHASVGERSMLGVFQQVVKEIENREGNALVSFDLMFEGIRNELRGEIQQFIILAERNLDDRFAVKVLKALFLVKYFGNFKTTQRNVSVLMIDDINVDLKEHERKVEQALNVLENQNYVQRNGDLYEFLTDDEKDVEEEIKNTDIDEQVITNQLKEIFFDEIIKDNKIRYADNKQDYDFTSKIDGATLGREKELEIEIITQNYTDYSNEAFLKSQTMGSPGMKVVLAPDAVFIKDLKMYLRTNKYVKQNQSTSNRSEFKRILQDKAQQNAERKRNLVLLANKSLANATVYMNGSKHEMGQTTDGKTRVVNAFQDLIKMVYPSLRMLGTTQYSEDTIMTTVRSRQSELFGLDENTVSEAESEIVNLINRRKRQSDRTSLADLRTHFTRKPYGWYPNAIWTITAKLYKRGKIEFKRDSNLLEDEDVLNALLNSANYGNTLLEAPTEVSPEAIKNLKQAYADAFDETCSLKEARDVANAFKGKLKEMLVEVNKFLVQKKQYPFLQSLEPFSEHLGRWSAKEYSYYLTNLSDIEDELLDAKEGLLDPIKRFMNGDQVNIYNSIQTILSGDTSNLDYVEGEELDVLKKLMEHEKPYTGNLIRDAKTAKDSLSAKVLEKINAEKTKANEAIEKAISDLKSKYDFNKLTDIQKKQIIQPLELELKKLKDQRYIAVIRDIKNRATDSLFTKLLNEMAELAHPVEKTEGGDAQDHPVVHYIKRNNVKIEFAKSELQTDEDVDEYLKAFEKALKSQIKNNRRIQL
ncbi:BREX system P-loop protein BrxC [Mangrovibacterium lignilyticum]|uniref:BREX system P-loop protein BrxC n=1 Tax=Mangrovibacterium lignilyticum TaxID=2668052 RepID=UPI0013D7041C|nr:BREX system P-loop protein BrxC [Mangrovibacterium lignilyticum]